jgi:hypothetical protein
MVRCVPPSFFLRKGGFKVSVDPIDRHFGSGAIRAPCVKWMMNVTEPPHNGE